MIRTWLSLLVVCFCSVLLVSGNDTKNTAKDVRPDELIASTTELEALWRFERGFVQQVENVATAAEKIAKTLRKYTESFEQVGGNKQGNSQRVQHPIDALLFIRHLSTSWPHLRNAVTTLKTLTEDADELLTREQEGPLPDEKTLEAAEFAIARLISAYDLNIKDLVRNGAIENRKAFGRLTAWDLGRLNTPALNMQLIAPAYELVEELAFLIDTHSSSQQMGQKSFSSPTSPLISPPFVEDAITKEVVMGLKTGSAKYHDEVLKKVASEEIRTFGRGLNPIPYNGRSWPKDLKVTFQLFSPQLKENPDAEVEREQILRLCQGEELRGQKVLKKLSCFFHIVNLWPFKVELLSKRPEILLVHDLISVAEANGIIRDVQKNLTGTNAGPSMSFKRMILDKGTSLTERVSRRIGAFTQTNALPVQHSEPDVIKNYGLAGTYGLHTDFRGANFTAPGFGERLASILVYLTDVQVGGRTVFPRTGLSVKPVKGAGLFYWNANATGGFEPLTVHSGCPVAVGNKWVLSHWINEFANVFKRPCLPHGQHFSFL